MQPKHFLILMLVFAFAESKAQFQKGTKMLGATIGSAVFSSGNTDYSYPAAQGYSADNINFNLSLSPSYGVFINSHTCLGLSLLISSTYQKVDDKSISDTTFAESKAANTDLGVGAFIRYYLGTSKSAAPFLHFYVNGGSGFGKTSGFSFGTDATGAYKDSYTGKSTGRSFFNAGLNLGLTKLINQHVGLEAFAGYTFSYSRIKTQTNSLRDYTSASNADLRQEFEPSQKFTGNGVNLGIGLEIFLEKDGRK